MSDPVIKPPGVRMFGLLSLTAMLLPSAVEEERERAEARRPREPEIWPEPIGVGPRRASTRHADGHTCGSVACEKDPSGACQCWCGRCKRARTARECVSGDA